MSTAQATARAKFPTLADFLSAFRYEAPVEAVYSIVVPDGRKALLRFAEEIRALSQTSDPVNQLQTLRLLGGDHLPSSPDWSPTKWLADVLLAAEALLKVDTDGELPPPPLPARLPLSDRFEDVVVRTESGATYEAPSEDLIFMILQDIEEGVEDFLIIEDRAQGDRYYIQTARVGTGLWFVEQAFGDQDLHFAATTPSMELVYATLTNWAFGVQPPEGLDWVHQPQPGYAARAFAKMVQEADASGKQ